LITGGWDKIEVAKIKIKQWAIQRKAKSEKAGMGIIGHDMHSLHVRQAGQN
jgi:hypothetical protein